jgi:hypothetical protein
MQVLIENAVGNFRFATRRNDPRQSIPGGLHPTSVS